jgi:penicillin amidase
MDSQPAAIYMSFFNALLADTFHDDLPEQYWPGGGADTWLTLRNLLTQPDSDWWDNHNTPVRETRDDILKQAFAEGYAALEKELGASPEAWKWGALHTGTFVNETLGRSGVKPIEDLFNRGPFPVAGWASVVNNTGGNLARDDRTDPEQRGDPYAEGTVPSMRLIVDLSNLNNSLLVHTTGQSGHAYHAHYVDMADLWRNIQYLPMLWSADDVQKQAEAHLTLEP